MITCFRQGPSLLAAFERAEKREATSKLGPDQEDFKIVSKLNDPDR